ncbi:hypothetical protein Mapa_014260 [Marchantia paleacea]|nr:hypothetical protein Mapa_014260 [Marchantia paleacea]
MSYINELEKKAAAAGSEIFKQEPSVSEWVIVSSSVRQLPPSLKESPVLITLFHMIHHRTAPCPAMPCQGKPSPDSGSPATHSCLSGRSSDKRSGPL